MRHGLERGVVPRCWALGCLQVLTMRASTRDARSEIDVRTSSDGCRLVRSPSSEEKAVANGEDSGWPTLGRRRRRALRGRRCCR